MMPLGGGGRRVLTVGLITMVLFAQQHAAWALCPNCLAQTRTLTPTLRLLGVFLLVPFVVAYVVFRAIRRACGAEATRASAAKP